jgi:hypothetical protein
MSASRHTGGAACRHAMMRDILSEAVLALARRDRPPRARVMPPHCTIRVPGAPTRCQANTVPAKLLLSLLLSSGARAAHARRGVAGAARRCAFGRVASRSGPPDADSERWLGPSSGGTVARRAAAAPRAHLHGRAPGGRRRAARTAGGLAAPGAPSRLVSAFERLVGNLTRRPPVRAAPFAPPTHRRSHHRPRPRAPPCLAGQPATGLRRLSHPQCPRRRRARRCLRRRAATPSAPRARASRCRARRCLPSRRLSRALSAWRPRHCCAALPARRAQPGGPRSARGVEASAPAARTRRRGRCLRRRRTLSTCGAARASGWTSGRTARAADAAKGAACSARAMTPPCHLHFSCTTSLRLRRSRVLCSTPFRKTRDRTLSVS